MRDEEHREPEVALERFDLLQDLALDDDVERGRRLVHDDQLRPQRERHCDDHALAHAARELVRVRACAPAVDADELEQLARSRERAPPVDALVRAHRVDELVADAHDRVERVHRALQDDRHVAPAEAAQLLGALAEQVLALEQDASARDPRRRTEELHDGIRDRLLPQPDSPARPTISPSRIARSTPSTARAGVAPAPYSTVSCRSSSSLAARVRATVGSSTTAVTPSPPTARRSAPADEHPEQPPASRALGPQTRVADLVDPGQQQHEAEHGERERGAREEERPPFALEHRRVGLRPVHRDAPARRRLRRRARGTRAPRR